MKKNAEKKFWAKFRLILATMMIVIITSHCKETPPLPPEQEGEDEGEIVLEGEPITEGENEGEVIEEGEIIADTTFENRLDAVFSPSGAIPEESVVYTVNDLFHIRPTEGLRSGKFEVFYSGDNSLISEFVLPLTKGEVQGLALASNSSWLAVMYHIGTTSKIFFVNIRTGKLLGASYPEGLFHFMVFAEGSSESLILAETDIRGEALTPYTYLDVEINEEDTSQAEVLSIFTNLSGANLPWINYGHDIGPNPYGEHDGFSSPASQVILDNDFAYLASKKVSLVRVFIFCDLRTGIIDDDESLTFDPLVYADMDQLVKTAEKYGLWLMPVLFDFRIADRILYEGEYLVGERPDLLGTRRSELEMILTEFLGYYGDNPTIYCWDLMNEPDNLVTAGGSETLAFFQKVAWLIHQKTKHLVTIGIGNWRELDQWQEIDLDFFQLHHYDNMGSIPLASRLGVHKPILLGELQPTTVTDKILFAEKNGYLGTLFWSLKADYSFTEVADEFASYFTR